MYKGHDTLYNSNSDDGYQFIMVIICVIYVVSIFPMGFSKHVVIRVQSFLIFEGWMFMFIIEKSWKVVKEVRLG